ncbi:ATP-binding protein [Xylophilus sp. GW821-FHT01B05]
MALQDTAAPPSPLRPRRIGAWWCAAALCLLPVLCLPALAADGTNGSDPAPLHLQQARLVAEPGAGWDAPATPPAALLAPDGAAWESVALPHARPRSLAKANTTLNEPPEVVWYRLELPAGAAGPGPFFYLPRWQTMGNIAIYADERMVYRSRGSLLWNGFNRPLWLPLTEAAQSPTPRTVLVRMANLPGVGGALSSAWVGSEQALQWRYRVRSLLQTDLITVASGTFATIGLFSFAVWCVRRRETLYLLFFTTAVAQALRTQQFIIGNEAPLLPDALFGWVTANAVNWWISCVYLFTMRVHGKTLPWVERGLVTTVAAVSLATLPGLGLRPETMLPLLYLMNAALAVTVALTGLWVSRRSGSRAGLVLSIWFALAVPAGIHDIQLANYRLPIERLYLAPYVSIGLFSIFLVILYQRYIGALRSVQAANAQLGVRLAERERELAASYAQLQALEHQRTLDAERQRLMQEMHDGIGSSLISALHLAEGGRLHEADMTRLLKECIDDLKLSIDSLEHSGTDLLSVLAALRFRLAPRLEAAGLALRWRVVDVPPLTWLDPQSARHILRILQEVLANILKHSGAQRIEIATGSTAEGDVLVWVHDNGVPHHAIEPAPPGYSKGLANVRNRAQALGAHCSWSVEEGGNLFELRLPARGAIPAG